MRGLICSFLLLGGLAACASTPREVSQSVYYAKPQMTAESYREDQIACLKAGDAHYRENRVEMNPAVSVVPTAIGLAGAPFGLAASAVLALGRLGAEAQVESDARQTAAECLEEKGYALREFDEAQSLELAELEGLDRSRRALELALAEAQLLAPAPEPAPDPEPTSTAETEDAVDAVATLDTELADAEIETADTQPAPPALLEAEPVVKAKTDARGRALPPVLTTD